jgi:tetratricopeptide (TPR) repeat protein
VVRVRTSRFRQIMAAVLILAIFAAASPAKSQSIEDTKIKMALQQARSDVAAGKFDRAITLLTELDSDHPGNPEVLTLLCRVYKYSEDYENARKTIERLEDVLGPGVEVRLQLADLYLKMGDYDKARDEFDKCLSGNQSDVVTLTRISDTYRSNGLYDEALNVYYQGRKRIGDPDLFAEQIGRLLEVQGNLVGAIAEFYRFMRADTSNVPHGDRAIRRIVENVDDAEQMEAVKKELAEISDSYSSDYMPLRYYADMLIRQDSLSKAFDYYKHVDKLQKDEGQFLVFFARRCMEREEYSIASLACRYVLDRYPGKPFFIQARFVLSSAYAAMGKGDSAVAVLQQIAEESPTDRDVVESAILIGQVYLQLLHNPDSALVYLALATGAPGNTGWHNRGLLYTADCYVAKGDLVMADSVYNEVMPDRLRDSEAEDLAWRKAQSKFFAHEYDEAKRLYARLTVDYSRGMHVNNSLQKMLMIDDNADLDRIDLDAFTESEYLIFRAEYDSAGAILKKLSRKEGSNLGDVAAFTLAGLQLSQGDTTSALESYAYLLESFPDSFWRGEALKCSADIKYSQGNMVESEAAYRKLLTDFDSVILKEHARRKLKEMENL